MDDLREMREQILRMATQLEMYIQMSVEHRTGNTDALRRMEESLRRLESTLLRPRPVTSPAPRTAPLWFKYVIYPVVMCAVGIATALAMHFLK